MTGVEDQEAALRRLVHRLDDTSALLAGVRAAVVAAWEGAAAREWADRLERARREADRLAAAVAEDLAVRDATVTVPSDRPPDHEADLVPGMRLPGSGGVRVGERRGTAAPLLPPFGPPTDGR